MAKHSNKWKDSNIQVYILLFILIAISTLIYIIMTCAENREGPWSSEVVPLLTCISITTASSSPSYSATWIILQHCSTVWVSCISQGNLSQKVQLRLGNIALIWNSRAHKRHAFSIHYFITSLFLKTFFNNLGLFNSLILKRKKIIVVYRIISPWKRLHHFKLVPAGIKFSFYNLDRVVSFWWFF